MSVGPDHVALLERRLATLQHELEETDAHAKKMEALVEVHRKRAEVSEAEIASKDRLLPSLLAEGKALEQARAEKAEADCAAMRKALEALKGEVHRMATDGGGFSCTVVDEADAALASDSGKPLQEERERRARLLREAMAAVDRAAPDLAGRIEKELEP